MVRVASVVIVFAAAALAGAQEGIAPETLTAVKQATVYLQLKHKGQNVLGGSGVVVAAANNIVYVVTNQHVAEPRVTYQVQVPVTMPVPPFPPSMRPPSFGPSGFGPPGFVTPGQAGNKNRNKRDSTPPGYPGTTGSKTVTGTKTQTRTTRVTNADISVMFEGGTSNERTLQGEVVAIDADADLALLRVRGEGFVKPINLTKPKTVLETTPVFAFGIPSGKSQALPNGGPPVSVWKGVITSLQQGADGELARLRLDTPRNAGKSGGPVVDADGRLVGVINVDDGDVSGGADLAVSRDVLMAFLTARVKEPKISGMRDGRGLQLTVSFDVIDPLGEVKSATLYCLAAEQWTDVDEPRHPLENHPDAKKFPLALKDGAASGKATFSAETGPLLLQLVLEGSEPNSTLVKVARWPSRSAPAAAELAQADTTDGNDPSMKEKEVGKEDGTKGAKKTEEPTGATKGDKAPSAMKETKGVKAARAAKDREQRRKEAEERSEQFRKEHGLDKRFSERMNPGGGKARKSEAAGPGVGNEFYDEAPSGALLVGFDFGHREFGGKEMIGAVRPIFRSADVDKVGDSHGVNFEGATTVKAKEGYAVGGLSVRAGLVINGVRVRFMRVKAGGLDPNDAYWSEFIGWDEGGSVKEFNGDGTPVIGVHGRADQKHCRAIGLVFQGK